MSIDPKIGEAIRQQRKALGITQDELARRVGVHVNTVRSVEAGGDLRLSTMAAIAAALECAPGELLAVETHPAAPVIDEYLASPYAQIDKPTEEERRWLRGQQCVRTVGGSPDAETVHLVLMARRQANRQGNP